MTRRVAADPSSPTDAFFSALDARADEPLLKNASGALRFELADAGHVERWTVVIDHGDVEVSHRNTAADVVVRVDKRAFEGMATGRMNATAAALRGELDAEGDLGLLLLFQRLFPGPPPRRAA